MAAADRHDRRWSVHANLAHKWTARSEAASRRERRHVRHHAADGGELVDAPIELRNAAEETDRVGMLRRREQNIDRRALTDLAPTHDCDLIANLRDHSQTAAH